MKHEEPYGIRTMRHHAQKQRSPHKIALAFAIIVALSPAAGAQPATPGDSSAAADDPATQGASESCTLASGPQRTVTRILDAETIALDDGSEVRLIGALAPRARDADAVAGQWPPEQQAIKALSDLVLGNKIRIATAEPRSDRYERRLAHVFVTDNQGRDQWVQGAMLAAGHARAYGLKGNFHCAFELLAHEAAARSARRGIWRNDVYKTKPAARPAYLMKLRSRFARIEGRVRAVAVTRSATYLNFGDDWRTDFTARIGRDVLKATPGLADTLHTLEGKRVAIRGWIERRNGPLIDIADQSQIERLTPEHPDTQVQHTPTQNAQTPAPIAAPDKTEMPPEQQRPASPSEAMPGAVDL